MGLWGLMGPKSSGQANTLEIQIRIDVAALSLKSLGQQAGSSGGVSGSQS